MNYRVTNVATEKSNEYIVQLISSDQRTFELTVHEELVLTYRLVVGKELSVEQFESLHAKLDLGKAYQYAINLLSRRSYTVFEVNQKLLQKEYDEGVVQDVLNRLVQSGVLNDERYANQYVQHHMIVGKKGPLLLERELSEKKISSSFIFEALKLYTEQEQLDNLTRLFEQQVRQNNKYGMFYLKQKASQTLRLKGFDSTLIEQVVSRVQADDDSERTLLEKELQKLLRRHEKLDPYKKKTKVIQTLARKGYHFDLISSVYDECIEMNED